jgi:hypothetical protein
MMSPEENDAKKPNEPKIPMLSEEQLRRAQELRRIIGDQRVRVEVPTGTDRDERPMVPTSRRYQIG